MEQIRTAFYFLMVLSALVLVHEWGHFIVAKLCKMRVDEFALFFWKRLIRLGVKNGTEYNIRSVPLGGFVKIAGMEPDDISNGAPIFRNRNAAGKKFPKTLYGLRLDSFTNVNFDEVSDRVLTAVDQAVGDDARLTEEGRLELQSLLNSSALNADEHRYIEAITGASLKEPNPDDYNQKPLWQRAAVIFAGPFMSLLFGYVLFCLMAFTVGLPDPAHPDNSVETVIKGRAADRAGLKPGDRITQINRVAVDDWESMVSSIHANVGKPVELTVQRDMSTVTITATPEPEIIEVTEDGKKIKKTVGKLGFWPGMAWKRYNLSGAIGMGTNYIGFEIKAIVQTIFSRKVKDNVGGPIAIVQQVHQDAKEGARRVLLTGAFLSVSLGVMNLLPIPILDGGHLLLLAWEGIRRRKLSTREVYTAQMLGLSIIGVLFILVMYNDIMRIFLGSKRP